jgi:hypothetical protein
MFEKDDSEVSLFKEVINYLIAPFKSQRKLAK